MPEAGRSRNKFITYCYYSIYKIFLPWRPNSTEGGSAQVRVSNQTVNREGTKELTASKVMHIAMCSAHNHVQFVS